MSAETETVQIVIDSLINAGVQYVFGVPGAKIDSVFNALVDHPEIKVIVCRHEQNAAFIAAAVGKLTGRPGVVVVTSGPGTSNLATGLVTANDEGSPMVAIVGSVKRAQAAKRTHQSLQAVALLRPVTKKVVQAIVEDQVAEVVLDAFRVAAAHPQGATVVSLPIDVMTAGHRSKFPAFPSTAFTPPEYGPAPRTARRTAIEMIEKAKFPVLYLGMRAADEKVVAAVHAFLQKHPMPVVETFQAAGSISQDLVHLFFGRIGLFRNQPGDKVIEASDLVITVGYDQAEYDADQWNTQTSRDIIHMDYAPAAVGFSYSPKLELLGSMADNINLLAEGITQAARPQEQESIQRLYTEFHAWEKEPKAKGLEAKAPVHPLYFIHLLQHMIDLKTVVASDIGSVYIWLSRYFFSYYPKTFLVSNAQQTLGVAMPWAIGASLVQSPPNSAKVVSISGDGGFLFSGQELVTAVLQGCNITHFIWNDGKYNMVEFQEVNKYGRSSGIDLGGVDFVKYAESMGAKGLRVNTTGELKAVMEEALAFKGVCVVDITIDYSENHELMKDMVEGAVA